MPGGRQGLDVTADAHLGFGHQDLSQDLIAASRFHRIIRRGREFGDQIKRQAALQPDAPDPRRGLYFICLNANISRQFEFIQNAWLISAKFGGMSGEADPLLGNRVPLPAGIRPIFSIPQPNGIVVASLESHLRPVRGGAYFSCQVCGRYNIFPSLAREHHDPGEIYKLVPLSRGSCPRAFSPTM